MVWLALVVLSGRLAGLEFALTDLRFMLRGDRPFSSDIVLVAIDEQSLAQFNLWPWSYGPLADLVNRLSEAGAQVIALDLPGLVTYRMLPGSPAGAERLAEAVRNCGRVVLPAVIHPTPQDQSAQAQLQRFAIGTGELPRPRGLETGRLCGPLGPLSQVAAGLGAVNVTPEVDGVLRRVPVVVSDHGHLYPAFCAEVVRVFLGRPAGEQSISVTDDFVQIAQVPVAVDSAGEVYLNYAGGYESYPTISGAHILSTDSQQLESEIAGKIALIGPTAVGLTNLHRTPTCPLMPGVEITANAIDNILTGWGLRVLPIWLAWVLAGISSVLIGWWLAPLNAWQGLLVLLVATVVYAGLSVLCFARLIILPTALPLLTIATTGAILVIRAATAAEREKSQVEAQLQTRIQTILGIGRLINSSLDHQQLLEQILQWIETELDVEAASVLMLDQKSRELRFEAASGDKADEIKDFTIQLGEGIAGIAAATGEALIVNDAGSDPRQAHDIPVAIDFPARSVLAVPMTLHGQVVGVVEAINKRAGALFTEDDASLLAVIAQEAALFMDNARLYTELQQRVDFANQELRGANQQLTFEKARIETLIREMASGIVATDAADRVVLINDTAQHMLGLDGTPAVGEPILALVDDQRLVDLFARPLSLEGGSHAEELELPSGSGTIVRAHIALVEDHGEIIGRCLLLTDVTQFIELDRMKTDLISFVSHELKNPLASMQGFVSLLQRHAAPPDERSRQYIEYVNQLSLRMQDLVQDFLNLSRIEAGQGLDVELMRIEDADQMVADIVEMEEQRTEVHQFVRDIPADLPPLRADRRKLQQVLTNLINNAVKFSPDGGQVNIAAQPEDGMVKFSVSDEGVGIAPDQMKHLFQKFQRVREEGTVRVPGTGLGLYLCKHLIESHGGQIWVDSEPGQGSTFSFTVPVDDTAGER